MHTINEIFGVGKELTTLQICARSFVMFFIALVLIRLGGMRMFGKKSAFDDIMVILLGAILSRGVVGANSFGATVAAAAVMILIHRILGWLSTKSMTLEKLVKGKAILLYKNGILHKENMQKTSMSVADLLESLRLETSKKSLPEIDSASMETNGRISFIEKE